MQVPNILTIAGSDSGGGAGIQADLKTIMAMGCYGMSAITALTAQNGLGVQGILASSGAFMTLQLETLFAGFTVHAAKCGMLFNAEIINAVADALQGKTFPLVVDPVSVSQSGSRLLSEEAITPLVERMLPLADVLTPNIPEAEMLSNLAIRSEDALLEAGTRILALCGSQTYVLIKGGHVESSAETVTDVLFRQGEDPVYLSQPRVHTINNHGTGCTLSAAIASGLGKGEDILEAVRHAQLFLSRALQESYAPGKGSGPVNHAAGLLARDRSCVCA